MRGPSRFVCFVACVWSAPALAQSGDALKVEGGLDEEVVRERVTQGRAGVERCLEDDEGAELDGAVEVVLTWSVDRRGRVKGATLESPQLDGAGECVAEQVSGWTFPKAKKKTKVSYRFTMTFDAGAFGELIAREDVKPVEGALVEASGGDVDLDRPRIPFAAGPIKIKGPLGEAQITRVVRGNWSTFVACHDDASREKGALDGKLVVRWVIDEEGKVPQVGKGRSTLRRPVFEACVGKAFERLSFPKPEGRVKVEYTLVFEEQ